MTCIPGLPDFRFALCGNRRYTPAPQSPVPTKNGPNPRDHHRNERGGLLQERGFSREQAYAICSVGLDLRISNVVDVPNFTVSALLPQAIFVK